MIEYYASAGRRGGMITEHTGRWRDGTRNGQDAPAVILYKTATGHDDDAATAAARNESAAPTNPTHPRACRCRALVRPSRRTDDGRIVVAPAERPRADRHPFHRSTPLTTQPTTTPPPRRGNVAMPPPADKHYTPPSLPPTPPQPLSRCPVRRGGGPYRSLVCVTYPLFLPAALPARGMQRALKMARIFLFRPYYYYYYDSLLHFTRNDITIIIIRR